MDERKAAVRDWYIRVWERGETDLISEMMSPNARINGLEEDTLVGPDDFIRFRRMILSVIKDVKVSIPAIMTEGDWISVLFHVDGVSKTTHIAFRTSGQAMIRFEDGLIVEAFNQVNLFPFFEACNLLPERTVDLCLMGVQPMLLSSAEAVFLPDSAAAC